MLDFWITMISIAIGLYGAWRYLRRFVRSLWELLMSNDDLVPADRLLSSEWLSYASEQVRKEPEQALHFPFPDVVPSEDDIMEWLALLPGEDDTYYFSASNIGKLFGGRLQDQIDRVRTIRGEEGPAPRTIRVRDAQGQREITIDAK